MGPMYLLLPLLFVACTAEKPSGTDSKGEEQPPVAMDADSDGYGNSSSTSQACDAPSGSSAVGGDCNDANNAVSPAATERCDSLNSDEDCDGLTDDLDSNATGKISYYADTDGDGYAGSSSSSFCDMPSGYYSSSSDCNDSNTAIHPGASEVCDAANTDEDCDGLADDTDSSVSGKTSWYVDSDGDGYGSSTAVSACDAPAGSVSSSSDCNDASASISPGATEVCGDSVDQDCSGADRACPGWGGSESADASYDHKIYGIGLQAQFGVGLAGGDFDGDGVGDLLVGDPGYNYSGAAAGAVFGYYGPLTSGAWLASAHDDFLNYNTYAAYDGIYGGQIANIGDITADGREDFLVLASNSSSLSYRGGDSGLSTYGYYIRTMACNSGGAVGNWDGGTNQDYFCADSTFSVSKGTVYVYSGLGSFSSGSYTGESSSDYAGYGAAAGDFDGDGLDDLVIGAYGNDSGGSEAGAVYLVLSPGTYGNRLLSAADAKITGSAASDNLGRTVKVFSDRDGDGYADMLIGAPGQDSAASNAGALYIVTNPSSGSISTVAWGTLTGEVASDGLGTAGVTIGEWDGDGVEDVVAGARNSDRSSSNAGAAFLFYGPTAGTQNAGAADMIWNGVNTSDYFGYTAATIPDMDGDGKDELALSALNGGHSTVAIATGAVWIWMGR